MEAAKNYPKDRDDAVDCLEMALRPLLQSGMRTLCFGSLNTSVSTIHERRSDKVVREIKKVLASAINFKKIPDSKSIPTDNFGYNTFKTQYKSTIPRNPTYRQLREFAKILLYLNP